MLLHPWELCIETKAKKITKQPAILSERQEKENVLDDVNPYVRSMPE